MTLEEVLVLIRGLPSSGKTMFAGVFFAPVYKRSGLRVCQISRNFEADSYFYVDGKYKFDPKKKADAHKDCQRRVEEAMRNSDRTVVVSNTFTQRWEMQPYIDMAEKFGWKLVVIDLFDGGCDDKTLHERNVHDVPLEAFKRMRERYEHSWSTGNPLPPWERESKE
jgi:predicted kinase